MRGYLAARLILSSQQVGLLAVNRMLPGHADLLMQVYFYGWWASVLVILCFLYRAASGTLAALLGDLPGLRDLAKLLYRWLVVVAVLLLIPAVISVFRGVLTKEPVELPMLRFLGAYSLAELLPLGLTGLIAVRRRLSARTRLFGVLAGLCLEPVFNLVRSWFSEYQFWGWGNFGSQVATDAVLVLWLLYFLRPEKPGQRAAASANMLHWDRIARRNLKLRRAGGVAAPAISDSVSVSEGRAAGRAPLKFATQSKRG